MASDFSYDCGIKRMKAMCGSVSEINDVFPRDGCISGSDQGRQFFCQYTDNQQGHADRFIYQIVAFILDKTKIVSKSRIS